MHIDEIMELCEGQLLDYGINLFLKEVSAHTHARVKYE